MYSAKPPFLVYPPNSALAQTVSHAVMQYSQWPRAEYSHGPPTRSPSFTAVTPAPRATTRPMPSWPGVNGGFGFSGQSPFAACRSVWQTPQASVLISISPGPGVGMSYSRNSSGLPNATTTAACIVLAMGQSLFELKSGSGGQAEAANGLDVGWHPGRAAMGRSAERRL